MRSSDWSSDVCSPDLPISLPITPHAATPTHPNAAACFWQEWSSRPSLTRCTGLARSSAHARHSPPVLISEQLFGKTCWVLQRRPQVKFLQREKRSRVKRLLRDRKSTRLNSSH